MAAWVECLDETSLLNAEEEASLFQQMHACKHQGESQQTEHLRNQLARVFMKLAISVARGFASDEFPLDELISEANVTLLRAIERFDWQRGFRFSTYLTHAVRRNLCRYITNRRKEKSRFIAAESLESASDPSLRTDAYEQEMSHALNCLDEMLTMLEPRENYILCSRFGYGEGQEKQTLKVVAEQLGVSRERVRQLERRSLAKLQALANQRHLSIPELNTLQL